MEADRWVEAAYEGRVSLSEWLRQAANAKAATMGEPREMPKVMPEARQEPAIVEIDHAVGSVREVPVKPKSAAELARAAAALAEGKGKEVTPDWRKK